MTFLYQRFSLQKKKQQIPKYDYFIVRNSGLAVDAEKRKEKHDKKIQKKKSLIQPAFTTINSQSL